MIQSKNMIKTIGDKMILKGISLEIDGGESVAVLGPNGAGKSTWLKITAGLLKPTEGELFIAGKSFKKDHLNLKQLIGYLGHQSFLYDHYTPVENLTFFAKLYHLPDPGDKIHRLLDEVGLSFFKHEPVRSFSRGMIQRLAIARAILHDPEILLLDEPHTGLDQQAVQILNQVIQRKKKEGVTVVMATHDFPQVMSVCDRAVIIKAGRVKDDVSLQQKTADWLYDHYERQAVQ
ncbi:heme exporter protein A [Evansella caseinilytica]|uniref:Heme exporter protein A n=1 Tax=Evansella caseinilytica TaxID=1503961 RepID=A0A1H3UXU5_9BACI|nr:heme ABC exporter ATP-binding protein CcmA [Evansella caseinilytica]SDZ67148.1 heme exporter protein A [Evansella caseinilytica]